MQLTPINVMFLFFFCKGNNLISSCTYYSMTLKVKVLEEIRHGSSKNNTCNVVMTLKFKELRLK